MDVSDGLSDEDVLSKITEIGLTTVIIAVAAYGLDKTWLGKQLTKSNIALLLKKSKICKFNATGEGGEYDTFVLDGPLFKKKLVIDKSTEHWFGDRGNLEINDVVSYIDKDPASLVHFSSLLFVFADQFQIEIMNGNNYIVEENKAIELISLIAPQTDRMVYVRATHHLLRNEVEIASSLIELHIKSNQFVGNKIIELKAVIDSRLK